MPPAAGGHYTSYQMQPSVQWVKSEQQDASDLLPTSNTHVRNGQPTPPPCPDENEQLSHLAFNSLSSLDQFQMDGFQAINAPLPFPPSVPLASVKYSSNAEQAPSPEHGQPFNGISGSSPPATRRRSHTPVEKTKPKVDKRTTLRSEYLERNRLAASKCRQKKKNHNQKLQAACDELEVIHDALSKEQAELNHIRLLLKNELLAHAQCNIAPINAYIQGMIDHVTGQSLNSSVFSPVSAMNDNVTAYSPDTGAFGFDGPAHFSPSSTATMAETRRSSVCSTICSTNAGYTYSVTDDDPVGYMGPDIDFNNLVDMNECT